ncbi:unnamed protein product [Rhizoctonia solani]|uniref:HIT domain-containing protein n=1 Tax=Rhizoctonia solani TaxID=456999 RepID=A0A8H3H8C8_9AGAM|nr:unnamed protein product [Rhizoctonia solani]CAE6490569.1 unnamed protein product [Rhizoctonia solani]
MSFAKHDPDVWRPATSSLISVRRLDPTSMLICTRNQAIELKDDTHGPSTALKKCIFCDVRKELGFGVVYENEELIVFKDRNPAAKEHLLVITRRHVESIKSLNTSDIPLLLRMRDAGSEALRTLGIPNDDQRFGFHIPPFNTVNHIHLHAQGLPYQNKLREKKYRMSTSSRASKTKGFSWYAELGQCVRILESGNRVGVFPC